MKAMSSPLLDYRFGWRWLLPNGPAHLLYLAGFDEAEQDFWRDALRPAVWVTEPREADGWIIAADGIAPEKKGRLMALLSWKTQWVVLVGSGSAVKRLRRYLTGAFGKMHEYGMLPAANPRLIVPLNVSFHAVAALALHRPGRWTARLGVRMAEMLARLGVYFPLRRRVLLIATRQSAFWPMGAMQAGASALLIGKGWNFALYLGTPDDNRKTVVLPLGETAPDVLIKIGHSLKAREALKKEADALAFLASPSPQPKGRGDNGNAGSVSLTDPLHGPSLAGQVPRMMGLVENDYSVTLYQEYRVRIKARPAVLEEAVIDFLAQLSMIDRRSCLLQEMLGRMTTSAGSGFFRRAAASERVVVGSQRQDGDEESAEEVIWRWLHRQEKKNAVVWEHRSHGDFAPWNCTWTPQGFFVYDWEESQSQSLAFGDAFYFVMAPSLHSSRQPESARAVKQALTLAKRVAARGGFEVADERIHLALWLLGKAGTHPGYAPVVEFLAQEVAWKGA